ncbi:MAG: DnaJ domain-containing protein [Promethearchaeia archaeon]
MPFKKSRYESLKILGLDRSASDEEIKLAYRRLAKKYHPDLNKEDPKTEGKFKKVQNAYDSLKDSSGKSIPVKIKTTSEKSPFSEFEKNFSDFDKFFDSIFQGFRSPFQEPSPFVDIEAELKRRKDQTVDRISGAFTRIERDFKKMMDRFFRGSF